MNSSRRLEVFGACLAPIAVFYHRLPGPALFDGASAELLRFSSMQLYIPEFTLANCIPVLTDPFWHLMLLVRLVWDCW